MDLTKSSRRSRNSNGFQSGYIGRQYRKFHNTVDYFGFFKSMEDAEAYVPLIDEGVKIITLNNIHPQNLHFANFVVLLIFLPNRYIWNYSMQVIPC